MIREVNERDRSAWRALGTDISIQLHKELREAPVGARVQELLNLQVDLITSIPREAAQRVQQLSVESFTSGTRAKEIAEEIARTGEVTRSRAMLIARTETSRAATVLTQARAESVGSVAYIWRTARDGAVRESHRKMEGQVVQWNDPPTLDGLTGHAGALPNCLLGSAKVDLSCGYQKLWRRKYSGPIVTLGFRDGSTTEATPNHPVLTGRGWLAINEIQEGDDLVYAQAQSFNIRNVDCDRLISRFDDFFSTSRTRFKTESASGSVLQFHGDGTEDNIDVVTIDSLLSDNFMSSTYKGITQLLLSRTLWTEIGRFFSVLSPSQKSIIYLVLGPFAGCTIRSLSQLTTLFGAHPAMSYEHGFGSIANIDTILVEPQRNYGARYPILGSQRLDAGSRYVGRDDIRNRKIDPTIDTPTKAPVSNLPISAERLAEIARATAQDGRSSFECGSRLYEFRSVIKKTTREFFGHVYNAQTNTGWYIADGYVTHNCRCYPESIVPDPYAPSVRGRRQLV